MCNGPCKDVVEMGTEQKTFRYSKSNKFIVDGAKLSKARIDAQMSMDDVAEVLGCNKSSVSRWEQGKLQPSETRIQKLTQLLGTVDFVRANSKNWRMGKEMFLGEGK